MLDTNVLMHDPTAIFRFEEHDVFLPMVVLEELDAHKKGLSEQSRNVRQVSRFLDDLMRGARQGADRRGAEAALGYSGNHGKKPSTGRLFFQTRELSTALPQTLPGGADNAILGQTLALQKENPEARVVLVSKDINLRIKAAVLGVHAEDYYSDKTLEDSDVLYSGMTALPAEFLGKPWQGHALLEGRRPHVLRSHRPRRARVADQPVRVRRQPAGHRSHRAQDRWRPCHARADCATIATSGTASGASPRAIASRTSR